MLEAEGYLISDRGHVKSKRNPDVLLAQSRGWGGRWCVQLSTPTGGKRVQVHCAMLGAFTGPRPIGLLGLHRDDNPDHNHLPNLYWGTRSDNNRDRVRNGSDHNARKTHCPQRHEYSPENTYIGKDGRRRCKRCTYERCRDSYSTDKERERKRRYRAAKKGVLP